MTKVAAKGLRFDYREIDEETHNIDEHMLVFTPVLSLLKLRFKKRKDGLDLPKI